MIDRTVRKEAEHIDREEQLAALIDSYQHLVFTICYRMTADYFASEDLTQETFLAAYRRLAQFDGAHEKAWLCRIAVNKCIDYLQSAGRRSVPTENAGEDARSAPEQSPESVVLEREVRQTLLDRCRALKPPYDEIAKAYYYDEMDAAEIAAQRNMKRKTVQTQIYRARAMLKKMYAGKEDGA